MSSDTAAFKNPIAKFIPSSHNTPTSTREVFVIGPKGEMSTGNYVTWNGKSEWRVASAAGIYFEPIWWADMPDTSAEATNYKP